MGESSGFILASGERMRSRARKVGTFSFWIQLVLAILSIIFWPLSFIGQTSYSNIPVGSTIALWITLLSIIVLGVTTFLTFQYSRTGSLSQLKMILYANLFGAFVTLISLASQIGDLLFNLFIRASIVSRAEAWGLLLATIDTNITLAHLISITVILWIYGILDRQANVPSK